MLNRFARYIRAAREYGRAMNTKAKAASVTKSITTQRSTQQKSSSKHDLVIRLPADVILKLQPGDTITCDAVLVVGGTEISQKRIKIMYVGDV